MAASTRPLTFHVEDHSQIFLRQLNLDQTVSICIYKKKSNIFTINKTFLLGFKYLSTSGNGIFFYQLQV